MVIPESKPVDVDKLAESILDKLPEFKIALSDGDPSTQDEVLSAQLGSVITLPPQRLRIRDGQDVFELASPLGDQLRIKVEGLLKAKNGQ